MTISVDDLEREAAGGWRATEEVALGEWLLRAAGGFTGRANSALAIGDPGLPLADAVEEVCRWYQARRLPPMVSIAYPLGRPDESPVGEFLARRGWQVRHGAVVMITTTGQAGDVASGTGFQADVLDEPDEAWLARYRWHGQPPPPISRKLLMSAPWQAFASIRESGETIAVGRVAASGTWAGLTAVEVDPLHRRRGVGTAITAALARTAADRGIENVYLQVEDDNQAAHELYSRCGFTDHHGYHYRAAPAAT